MPHSCINPAFFQSTITIDSDDDKSVNHGYEALWHAGLAAAFILICLDTNSIIASIFVTFVIIYAYYSMWHHLNQIPSPPPLAKCPTCNASGFSTPGSGYDAVCPNCGGQRQIVIN